jgi:hypothetical protein
MVKYWPWPTLKNDPNIFVVVETEQTMKARVEYDRSAGPGMTAVQQNSKQTVRLLTTLSPSLGGEMTRLNAVAPGRATETGSRTRRVKK